MTETWQQIAARKRPAEDALIERYRFGHFKGDAPAPGRGYPTAMTPWGMGRQFFSGMYIAGFGRRSAWPETQIVLKLFLETEPDRRVLAMRSLWPPGRWHEDEPPYNEMFDVNLAESIHKRAPGWLAVQPGPTVYFIWRNSVDFAEPPAAGEPPLELLKARAEIDQIMSGWRP